MTRARDLANLGGPKQIGEPFGLWTHLAGCPLPDNSGTAKFIELTVGLTGSGQYNEGLLGSESTTGSGHEIVHTAEILVGPMTGATVHLINSMERFRRPSETSGTLQDDTVGPHVHATNDNRIVQTSGGTSLGSGGGNFYNGNFSVTATTITSGGGPQTQPIAITEKVFMRIA